MRVGDVCLRVLHDVSVIVLVMMTRLSESIMRVCLRVLHDVSVIVLVMMPCPLRAAEPSAVLVPLPYEMISYGDCIFASDFCMSR